MLLPPYKRDSFHVQSDRQTPGPKVEIVSACRELNLQESSIIT